MIARLILQIALIKAVTSQSCQQAVETATLDYYSGHSWKWTYMDYLDVQHGNPNNKKCNFMKNNINLECLNEEGICKNETQPKPFVHEANMEGFYTGGNHIELIKIYGHGVFGKKRIIPYISKKWKPRRNYLCDPKYPYRSLNGSCNNLIYPYRGMAGINQRRFISSDYDDDRSTPRTRSRCDARKSLPSPRLVSNSIHAADALMDLDSTRSLFIMQMGQFLAHDFVLTPIATRGNGEPLECCDVDHANKQCFPIIIPPGDPRFANCMNFARSEGRISNGQREQRNIQTSYLDLSMVYGVSVAESNTLRTFYGGQLKTVLNKLPRDVNDMLCQPTRPTDPIHYYCPLAGDARVNEGPGLSAIHTIFTREHNRLARALAQVNPFWNDEKLFQEARKINIGQWQHIIYNEYLPATIGTKAMQKHNLWVSKMGYRDTYQHQVDASIVISFSTAIMRFGHSLIPNFVKLARLNDEAVFLKGQVNDNFMKPDLYHANSHTGMDNILKWMSTTACPLSDRKIEPSVQQFLFLDSNLNSLDLVSLNIQRGRDHGLRGYNWFRYYVCGLLWVHNFGTGYGGLVDHEPEVARLLSRAYLCPDDIDLFTGHMTEKHRPGSQLGPTGECLMGFQMRRLRDGDRFFYERYDIYSGGFTPSQLSEIKKVRLSDLFCLNSANVPGKRMQRGMLFQPRRRVNEFVECSTVPGININFWKVKYK